MKFLAPKFKKESESGNALFLLCTRHRGDIRVGRTGISSNLAFNQLFDQKCQFVGHFSDTMSILIMTLLKMTIIETLTMCGITYNDITVR